MKKYYFNTGVKLSPDSPVMMPGVELSPNGVKVIPFYCDGVPDGYTFAYASTTAPTPEGWYKAEIHNSTLLSKYAYFKPCA